MCPESVPSECPLQPKPAVVSLPHTGYDNAVIARERIDFSEYATLRMHQRDILEDEVLDALAAVMSRPRNRPDRRSEVRHRTGGRVLLVIYRRERTRVLVINAMWE